MPSENAEIVRYLRVLEGEIVRELPRDLRAQVNEWTRYPATPPESIARVYLRWVIRPWRPMPVAIIAVAGRQAWLIAWTRRLMWACLAGAAVCTFLGVSGILPWS